MKESTTKLEESKPSLVSNDTSGLTTSSVAAKLDFNRPHRYVDVGHSELAYWKVGAGPDIVLVHGWPLHSATYRNIAPIVAKHFTCHLFDFPGAGKTKTGPNAHFGIVEHAKTLHHAIKKVGITHFGLVGHDSGAAIMQYVAAEVSTSVFGLVIANTEIPNFQSPMLKLLLGIGSIPVAANLFFLSLRFKALRNSIFGFGSCFHDTSLIDGEFGYWFGKPLYENSTTRQGQGALLKKVEKSEIDQLAQVQAQISAPVQFLWGDKDIYFPIKEAKKMTSRFKGGAEFHTFKSGRLFMHEEFSERFATMASEFFSRALRD